MRQSDKENEKMLKLLSSIENWVTFFGVMAILGIVAGAFSIIYAVTH